MRCTVCGNEFNRRGRALSCSEACKAARHLQKVKEQGERRKNGAPHPPCAACGKTYVPVRGNQKYHNSVCASVGMQQAIERQRARRQAAKLEKEGAA